MDFSDAGRTTDLETKEPNDRAKPFRRYMMARSKPKSCSECEKRPQCTSLCPDVKRWVDQDMVGSGGYLLGNKSSDFGDNLTFVDLMALNHEDPLDRDTDLMEAAWERIQEMRLSKASVEFVDLYYRQGMRKCEIAELLNISDQAVDVRHKTAMRMIRERLSRDKTYQALRHVNFVGYPLVEKVIVLYFSKYMPILSIASSLDVRPTRVYAAMDFILEFYAAIDTAHEV
jgi:predicted DNA-binding protein YlxM (UPF0122 family)